MSHNTVSWRLHMMKSSDLNSMELACLWELDGRWKQSKLQVQDTFVGTPENSFDIWFYCKKNKSNDGDGL